jgi:hypothetical protein
MAASDDERKSQRLDSGVVTNLFDDSKMLPNPPVQRRPLTGGSWKLERVPDEHGLGVMRKVVVKRLESRGKAVDEVISAGALE